jgi:hypothetical protein
MSNSLSPTTQCRGIGIRLDPFCMLCSVGEPNFRNHLEQSAAMANRAEREARTIRWETDLNYLLITITTLVTTHYYRMFLLVA